jgi:hypothetical protein
MDRKGCWRNLSLERERWWKDEERWGGACGEWER